MAQQQRSRSHVLHAHVQSPALQAHQQPLEPQRTQQRKLGREAQALAVRAQDILDAPVLAQEVRDFEVVVARLRQRFRLRVAHEWR